MATFAEIDKLAREIENRNGPLTPPGISVAPIMTRERASRLESIRRAVELLGPPEDAADAVTELADEIQAKWPLPLGTIDSQPSLNVMQDVTKALGVTATHPKQAQPESTTSADGPVAPDGFRWQGEVYQGLAPIPWKLLAYCWDSPDHCGSYDGMADAVWGDREYEFAGDPVKNAARRVREFFQKHGIPLTCSNSVKHRSVSIRESA